jgi:hypothetical protein
MLPKKSEVGRKDGDVQRSEQIVDELEKMEVVDCKVMDPVEKRRSSMKKDELRGELFQITKGIRYELLDETLNDLKRVNQFLQEPEVLKEEIEFYDHTTLIQPEIPPLKKVIVGGKELSVDLSLSEKWEKQNPIQKRVEERSHRLLIVRTNRGQIKKLKDILIGFREMILHGSSLWPIEKFDEEKKKVELEIGAIDLSKMSEERLSKDEFEMLQYALNTKNEVT